MIQRLFISFLFLLCWQYSNSQQADSIVLNNAVLYYYSYGTGEPVIILSGGPGIAAHQEDDVAIELSKHYKAILFDQRGTGRSWTKPLDSSTININTAIEDLDTLRKHLHLDKLNLYGHSWGSMLAAAYIAKYPDRVKLFISVGGGEIDTSLTQTINDNVNAKVQLGDTVKYRYWLDAAVIKKDSAKAAYEIRKLKVARSIYDTSKLDHVMTQVAHGGRNTAMAALMWKSIRKQLHFVAACNAYSGKTLLVFGLNDMIGLTTVTQYLQAFPKAAVAGIFKSGHYPEIEQPEQFYAVVNQFLQAHLLSLK